MPSKRHPDKRLFNWWVHKDNHAVLKAFAQKQNATIVDVIEEAIASKCVEWGVEWKYIEHSKFSNRWQRRLNDFVPVDKKERQRHLQSKVKDLKQSLGDKVTVAQKISCLEEEIRILKGTIRNVNKALHLELSKNDLTKEPRLDPLVISRLRRAAADLEEAERLFAGEQGTSVGKKQKQHASNIPAVTNCKDDTSAKDYVISLRVDESLKTQLSAIADYNLKTSSKAARMLLGFAIDKIQGSPDSLIKHFRNKKS